jgi:hypothetical protein
MKQNAQWYQDALLVLALLSGSNLTLWLSPGYAAQSASENIAPAASAQHAPVSVSTDQPSRFAASRTASRNLSVARLAAIDRDMPPTGKFESQLLSSKEQTCPGNAKSRSATGTLSLQSTQEPGLIVRTLLQMLVRPPETGKSSAIVWKAY